MKERYDIKQWETIFRGLGSANRLRILRLLHKNGTMSVSELAKELDISFKNTSRNLRILVNLDFLEFEGKRDRVYYRVSPRLLEGIRQILRISII